MKPSMLFMILCLSVFFVFPAGSQPVTGPPQPTKIDIDWTRDERPFNRALFSTQGFMQVFVEENPMVMESFELTNPKGTQTRLETYIHQMEPQNDNDDPSVFNWDKFQPNRMIRFIEDREPFEQKLDELGMDRLFLACYNVKWLESDNPDDPVSDKEEWAEYVAAVVETYNVRDGNEDRNLEWVEVWNEPNMDMFYTGTMESYFELYNITADRIHKEYPGVKVGGPALTHAPQCNPDEWMFAFLENCGEKADYISYHHYGPQGEPVSVLTNDVIRFSDAFREIPGKEDGKVMITEIDAWFQGWPKMQHILERQFRFMELSDRIHSIHHFCCMAYNESGNYTFGIVDKQGAIIGGVFWPYWLFRNLIGEESEREFTEEYDLMATNYEDNGQWLGSAVIHNKKQEAPLAIRALLHFPPAEFDRALVFNRITENFQGVDSVMKVPARVGKIEINHRLEPGEALALNLQEPGNRIYAFRDMNNQERPWVGLKSSVESINYQESFHLDVTLLNSNFEPYTGVLEIRGLPEAWKVETVMGETVVDRLRFGESRKIRFKVTAETLPTPSRVAPYAVLVNEPGAKIADLDQVAHSIPVAIEVISPVEILAVPQPLHAVAGEENIIDIQLTNQMEEPIKGTVKLQLPAGVQTSAESQAFSLEGKAFKRYTFPLEFRKMIRSENLTGTVVIPEFGKVTNFQINMGPRTDHEVKKPVDLSEFLNLDVVSFEDNVRDFDQEETGLFCFPGDFTPSDITVNIRGIPYQFPSLEDGKNTVILPQGQVIPVEKGQYDAIGWMGYGHTGSHPGQWVLHYEGGEKETVDSMVPEWCTPPPPGYQVAFRAPHRYWWHGIAQPACELFTWTIEVDPGKTLEAVELPTLKNSHLFCMTLLGNEAE